MSDQFCIDVLEFMRTEISLFLEVLTEEILQVGSEFPSTVWWLHGSLLSSNLS